MFASSSHPPELVGCCGPDHYLLAHALPNLCICRTMSNSFMILRQVDDQRARDLSRHNRCQFQPTQQCMPACRSSMQTHNVYAIDRKGLSVSIVVATQHGVLFTWAVAAASCACRYKVSMCKRTGEQDFTAAHKQLLACSKCALEPHMQLCAFCIVVFVQCTASRGYKCSRHSHN
jgi:hypothetical protein